MSLIDENNVSTEFDAEVSSHSLDDFMSTVTSFVDSACNAGSELLGIGRYAEESAYSGMEMCGWKKQCFWYNFVRCKLFSIRDYIVQLVRRTAQSRSVFIMVLT